MEFKSSKFSDVRLKLLSKKRSAAHIDEPTGQDDFKVVAEFPAHQGLLASFSTWFEAKLLWPTAKPSSNPIHNSYFTTECSDLVANSRPAEPCFSPNNVRDQSAPGATKVLKLSTPEQENQPPTACTGNNQATCAQVELSSLQTPYTQVNHQQQSGQHKVPSALQLGSGNRSSCANNQPHVHKQDCPVTCVHREQDTQLPKVQSCVTTARIVGQCNAVMPSGNAEPAAEHHTEAPWQHPGPASQREPGTTPMENNTEQQLIKNAGAARPDCGAAVAASPPLTTDSGGHAPSESMPEPEPQVLQNVASSAPDSATLNGVLLPNGNQSGSNTPPNGNQSGSISPSPMALQPPTLDIMVTEENVPLLETMIQYMYARHQEATWMKPAGSALALLKTLPQCQLVRLLMLCDYYGVPTALKESADMLSEQALELSTVSDIYALPDSLAEQDHVQPVAAAARTKLMELFGDLEVALATEQNYQAFCELPLKAVTEILSSPETKVISEDTAAVAACNWINFHPATLSQQDLDQLFGCLRLQWLSAALRSLLPLSPGYQPLYHYMQHPLRKLQLDFVHTWRDSKHEDIMRQVKQFSILRGVQLQDARPKSKLQRIRLAGMAPVESVRAAVKQVQEGMPPQLLMGESKHFGGFTWLSRQAIIKEGVSLSCAISPYGLWGNAQPCPIQFPLAVIRSVTMFLGPVSPQLAHMRRNIAMWPFQLGWETPITMCGLQDWQQYVHNDLLHFQVIIHGPPLL